MRTTNFIINKRDDIIIEYLFFLIGKIFKAFNQILERLIADIITQRFNFIYKSRTPSQLASHHH
jgi:hypothetical protein